MSSRACFVIAPVKDEMINAMFGMIPLGKIVARGDEMNFGMLELGIVLYQIERVIRRAGLRKEK